MSPRRRERPVRHPAKAILNDPRLSGDAVRVFAVLVVRLGSLSPRHAQRARELPPQHAACDVRADGARDHDRIAGRTAASPVSRPVRAVVVPEASQKI